MIMKDIPRRATLVVCCDRVSYCINRLIISLSNYQYLVEINETIFTDKES